jgi:serine O-acetyltransferase
MCAARNFLLKKFSQIMLARVSAKTGIQIPARTAIGPGLYIGHGISVVIHPNTVIGDNFTVSQFTTIGSNKNTPAQIGNNVYVGPGCCIVEDVKIGNNARIGAGSVVVKDVAANTTVGGNPAKVISQKHNDPNDPNIWRQSDGA